MISLLVHVLEQVDIVRTDGLVKRIEGIIQATNDVFEPSVTTYMAHQARLFAQYAKIAEETLIFSTTRCGL